MFEYRRARVKSRFLIGQDPSVLVSYSLAQNIKINGPMFSNFQPPSASRLSGLQSSHSFIKFDNFTFLKMKQIYWWRDFALNLGQINAESYDIFLFISIIWGEDWQHDRALTHTRDCSPEYFHPSNEIILHVFPVTVGWVSTADLLSLLRSDCSPGPETLFVLLQF